MEVINRKRERHGMRWTKIYMVWLEMTARCRCKSNNSYERYGGRGISVCHEWHESFIKFYNDMHSSYSDGLEIDRIDNDGNYCKENCRWVTRKVNIANRRGWSRSGHPKGVHPHGNKFRASISIDKKRYYIGLFDNQNDASIEFNKVHKEWYGF